MAMFTIKLLLIVAACVLVKSTILDDMGRADVEAVRIRLEEEKAKRLLLQNDVEVLMLQVEDLKRKVDQQISRGLHRNLTLVTPGVGFTATLSLATTHAPRQTVIFDDVNVNEGNNYDSSSGRFIAPFRGLYSFSVTVMKTDSTHVHLVIMKDKVQIGKAYSGNAHYVLGSVTVVTVMDIGQAVYIQEYHNSPETIYGDNYATFTGVLLHRYD